METSRIDPERIPKRTLRSGAHMPCIGMGTFGSDRYTADQISGAVSYAIDMGYRLFDCASVYGNEAQIGGILQAVQAEGRVARGDLFIISKLWNDRHGPGDVLFSCAQSLRDLRTEYLDAYFVHWPFPNYHAPGCDGDSRNPNARPFRPEAFLATWRQMERLFDMGLVRHLGMSNMTIPKLAAVLPHCRIQPALIEMELHPCFQQPALFAFCRGQGIQPIGYSPIGSPSRPARDRTDLDAVDMEEPVVKAIAQAHGVHPASVCLKWAVQRGQIPIPFSVDPRKIASNLRCVAEDPLTEAEMTALAGIDRDCRLIKGQVFLWPGAAGWEARWDMEGEITRG